MAKKRILFVCLGNICRSPTAEAVFKHKINQQKIHHLFEIDSAGTSGNHVGEGSDHRSIRHAHKRGYVMDHKARKFEQADFSNFDLLVCMDDQNYANVIKHATSEAEKLKVKKMATYLKNFNDTYILDPWAMGPEAFERVIDLIEDACDNLLAELI